MNKHNIPGIKSFPRRLLSQSVLLVSKAHLSPLTFHQILPPRMGREVGRNTEMKKTGVMVGSGHKPPPALREETNGQPRDRPHVKNPHNSHRWSSGRREATTTRKEAAAKAARESRTRTLKKKQKTSVLKLLHQFLLSSFSAVCSSDMRSPPHLEETLISSCT